jgi:protocatechuate 3,4-dioxygenase beta subunit
MERSKIWFGAGLTAVVLILGLWLWGRDKADSPADADQALAGAQTGAGASSKVRRASDRPALLSEAKAAITGTVRDREGQPIAGAQVCAWAWDADLEGIPPGPPRCTSSEDDGRYHLDGLLPIRALVNAEARGFLPARWFGRATEGPREGHVRLAAGQVREGIDFTLAAGGVAVTGVVRDISGGVVPGAAVWARGVDFFDGARSFATSDAEGRFELWVAAERFSAHAEADGYAPGDRMSAAPNAGLEVVLTPESVIRGRVVLAGTTEPVAGVEIRAGSLDGPFFRAGGSARSDDRGEFVITRLAPGVYTLEGGGDELFGRSDTQIHLALAETADGKVVELHPAFMVTGEVVIAGNTTPKPCPSGSVSLTDKADANTIHSTEIQPGGEVELRALLPGTYAVEVWCPGTVREAEYPDVTIRDASHSGLRWEVREGLAIRGEVVDSDGQPVAGARVYASMKADADDPRKQLSSAMSEPTLDDGRFESVGLLPGRYQVSMFSMNAGPQAEPVTVVLEPGSDIDGVELVVPATGSVTGTVRDQRGQVVAGVTIQAASTTERRASATGISDDQGRFSLTKLAPGEVRVTAHEGRMILRAPGTSDDDLQGVVATVVASDSVEVTLTIEAQTATIRGRVVDPDGGPVADAFVSHQRVSDSAAASPGSGARSLRWGFDDRPVLTDVDGRFTITGLVDQGSYALLASRKGGGEAVADSVAVGEEIELTIVETGSITGKLVVDGGEAPARATLELSNTEGLSRSFAPYKTGGAFTFEGLPPSTYTLSVDSPAGSARIENLELAAGEAKTDVVVTLSPRATVRGRLVDLDTRAPVPGLIVSITQAGGSIMFQGTDSGSPNVSDADGRFEVSDALTGKIMLMARPRSYDDEQRYSWNPQRMTIPSGEPVVELGDIEVIATRAANGSKPGDLGFTLAPGSPDAEPEDYIATVAVVRPGGPAQAAGLALGDVITSVDGHDVRGEHNHRYYPLTNVAAGTAVEFGLADGRELTVTAGPPIK